MSKILINHTYKCLPLTILDDEISAENIINSLCLDKGSNEYKILLSKLSAGIITNHLYDSSISLNNLSNSNNIGNFNNNYGLIPLNSKLYSNGANTQSIPSINQIYELMECKIKIDNEKIDKIDSKVIIPLTGHFRYQLPLILPPQILVIISDFQNRNKLLLIYHGNNKLFDIITNYLRNSFNCLIDQDFKFNSNFLASSLNWSIENDKLESVGNIGLWFGKLETNGKLGTIIVRIFEKDMKTIKNSVLNKDDSGGRGSDSDSDSDNEDGDDDNKKDKIMEYLYNHLEKQTSINFHKLLLVRIQCDLFTIYQDGRIRFTDNMTPKPSVKNDKRLSIWGIISKILE